MNPHPSVTDEEVWAQSGYVTCESSHSLQVAGGRVNVGLLTSYPVFFMLYNNRLFLLEDSVAGMEGTH